MTSDILLNKSNLNGGYCKVIPKLSYPSCATTLVKTSCILPQICT